MEHIRNHLRSLIQLAVADQEFDPAEQNYIQRLGKAHQVPEEEINQLIREELQKKEPDMHVFSALTEDEKFEYLYNIVQLMKVDHKVYLSEIKFCEKLAEKLGFNPKVIGKLSSRIYADPAAPSNREALKRLAKQFEI